MPSLRTPHGELFYEDLNPGASGAPVLLLHNFMSTGRIAWGKIALELATTYRVLLPDLPGHGRSRGHPPDFDHRTIAGDMAALLADLGLTRVHIAGASAGGAVALWLVQDDHLYANPLEPLTLTLVSTTYSTNPATTGTELNLDVDAANFDPGWLEATARLHDVHHGAGYFDTTLLPAFQSLSPDTVIDLPGTVLASWELPVCIIHGARDRIFPVALAEQMAAAMPHSELHVIPNQGHDLIFRQSRQVLQIMQAFLAQHSESGKPATQN